MDSFERALDRALGNWSPDDDVGRFEEAAHKIALASSAKPYTGYYLRNIVRGKQPVTKRVAELCDTYLSSENGVVHEKPNDQSIRAAADVEVVEGSLILQSSRLCICGNWFVPKSGNQVHHTHACKLLARRLRRRQREH
jgi:ribosomal protein S26